MGANVVPRVSTPSKAASPRTREHANEPTGGRGNADHHSWAPAVEGADLRDRRRSMNYVEKAAMLPANGCPRCNAPDGIQRLVTSMVRYYVCGRCDCRWQVSRDLGIRDEADVEGADSVGSRSVVTILRI
jgi:hypothetical protein